MKFETTEDTTVTIQGMRANIPKGTSVSKVKGGDKNYFTVNDTNIVIQQFPYCSAILRHHFRYHFLFVPDNIVKQV